MLAEEIRQPLRSDSLNRRAYPAPGRVQQVSPISLISLLYALSLFAFYQQGFVSRLTFIGAAAFVLGCALFFHAVFKLGLHLRFHEPSLMLPQLIVALMTMLGVAYLERSTQIALVPFILIAFSFGIFRLSTAALISLALACLVAYLGIILSRSEAQGYATDFRTDLLQWVVLALTLPGMIILGKQLQTLRQVLRATRYQLEQYEEKSIRDELTGLYNRRQLQTELSQAKAQAEMTGVPFSICLVDIDHFKQINDSKGHLAGDKILRDFSRAARATIRESDIFGRYGGDEFLQILPDTDVKGAVMHAERLRINAHFLDFQILPQKHISLSIGVAQYREGEKITDLIARADAALYRAKQQGRNRVEWIDGK